MHNETNKTTDAEQLGGFQLILLVLSAFVLVAMFVETIFDLPPHVRDVLQTFDTLICVVFLTDFFVRFYRAERKLSFLKWGWIDFVSSIPNVSFLRVGRMVSILRLFRILRALRSVKLITQTILKNRARGGLTSVILLAIVMILFSSIVIINCEKGPEVNIHTGGDAVWWAMSTMTTVGYGDKYPVTLGGRVMGMILMICGIALVSTFTAYITTYFIETPDADAKLATAEEINLLTEEIKSLREKIERLEKKLP